MSANAPSAFSQSSLIDTVGYIDRDANGVTIEELRSRSKYFSEKLMDHLRSAAEELRSGKVPRTPESTASLREAVNRLSQLNSLKNQQESEIRSLYGGTMRDFYTLFSEVRDQLDVLDAGANPSADWKQSKPAGGSAKESRESPKDSFSAKREFLIADDTSFKDSDGNRTTVFGKIQLQRLLATPGIIPNEDFLNARILDIAGSPLNLADANDAKKVREKFLQGLSLRLKTLELLYERTVGKKIGRFGGGGLIHILKGEESKLVERIFSAFDRLEKSASNRDPSITRESLLETLKAAGLGIIAGPIYLSHSTHVLGKEEIVNGKDSTPLSARTSDSKANLEIRATPVFRIFNIALGLAVEANANFNHREAEILGKVKEAAKALDEATDPKTGKLILEKVPASSRSDAEEYNRVLSSMQSGGEKNNLLTAKALRDASLLELTKRLVNTDPGTEFKGVGIGLVLLFWFLPIRAYVKAELETLSNTVTESQGNTGLSSFDAMTSPTTLEALGITKESQGASFVYRIDPKRQYKIENLWAWASVENGIIRSDKPLAFNCVTEIADTIKEGEEPVQKLIINVQSSSSAEAIASSAKRSERANLYETSENTSIQSEVVQAMKNITSTDIRDKSTNILKLQKAIADAYASGDPSAAYALLPSIRVRGKRPLAVLAKKHAGDTSEKKREILEAVLQETAGDWRIRDFDRIKTDAATFKDFVKRTGYKGSQKDLTLGSITTAWQSDETFNTNLLTKTDLRKMDAPKQAAAISAVSDARKTFSEGVGKIESIEKNSRVLKNVIGFVNFHQVATDGKTTYARFQDVVPVAGTVKTVDIVPEKFENADIRRELVGKIPKFVLESLLQTINTECAKVGATPLESIDDVRKALVSNGDPKGFRPDIKLTSALAYTRFSKCLNDTYLIADMALCVDGPKGESSCEPSIPEVESSFSAPVGTQVSNVSDTGLGITTAGSRHDRGSNNNNGGNNGGPGGTTTPGVNAGAGNVVVPGPAAGF